MPPDPFQTSRPSLQPGMLEDILAPRFGFTGGNYPSTGNAGLSESARTRAFHNQLQPLYNQVQGVPRSLTERLGIASRGGQGMLSERGSMSLSGLMPNAGRAGGNATNFLAGLGIDNPTALTANADDVLTGAGITPRGATPGLAAAEGAAAAGRGGLYRRMGGTTGVGQSIGRGLGGVALGLGAAPLGEALGDDSAVGNFAEGAALGGGAGMGFFGPKGALIGALAGGLGNALTGGGLEGLLGDGGGSDIDPDDALDQVLDVSGVSPETIQLARQQYAIKTAIDDSEESKLAALNEIGTMVIDDLVYQDTQGQQTESALATQAMAQQYMQPLTQQMQETAQMRADVTQRMLPNLPPEYRGIAELSSAQNLDRASQTAAAYANQVAMMPTVDALNNAQGLQQQLGQQLDQQMLQQIQGQGQGGGGGGILQQLGIGA